MALLYLWRCWLETRESSWSRTVFSLVRISARYSLCLSLKYSALHGGRLLMKARRPKDPDAEPAVVVKKNIDRPALPVSLHPLHYFI
jgi:hypothetical protein